MLGSNSRSFNPAAAPKVTLSFPPGTTAAQMPAFLRHFTRRPPIILPNASFVPHVAKHHAWPASAVTAGGHFRYRLRAARRVRRQSRRPPGFGVAGSPWLGLAGGLARGLALMQRDRWRGIVGYAAESSASPRAQGPGRVQEQRRKQ
jgi:hypothetical protein